MMTPYQIEQCMRRLGYDMGGPEACIDQWIASFNSTPPKPTAPVGGWTITFVCNWLSAYYTGSNPCT